MFYVLFFVKSVISRQNLPVEHRVLVFLMRISWRAVIRFTIKCYAHRCDSQGEIAPRVRLSQQLPVAQLVRR